jgi:hypothetical protein
MLAKCNIISVYQKHLTDKNYKRYIPMFRHTVIIYMHSDLPYIFTAINCHNFDLEILFVFDEVGRRKEKLGFQLSLATF